MPDFLSVGIDRKFTGALSKRLRERVAAKGAEITLKHTEILEDVAAALGWSCADALQHALKSTTSPQAVVSGSAFSVDPPSGSDSRGLASVLSGMVAAIRHDGHSEAELAREATGVSVRVRDRVDGGWREVWRSRSDRAETIVEELRAARDFGWKIGGAYVSRAEPSGGYEGGVPKFLGLKLDLEAPSDVWGVRESDSASPAVRLFADAAASGATELEVVSEGGKLEVHATPEGSSGSRPLASWLGDLGRRHALVFTLRRWMIDEVEMSGLKVASYTTDSRLALRGEVAEGSSRDLFRLESVDTGHEREGGTDETDMRLALSIAPGRAFNFVRYETGARLNCRRPSDGVWATVQEYASGRDMERAMRYVSREGRELADGTWLYYVGERPESGLPGRADVCVRHVASGQGSPRNNLAEFRVREMAEVAFAAGAPSVRFRTLALGDSQFVQVSASSDGASRPTVIFRDRVDESSGLSRAFAGHAEGSRLPWGVFGDRFEFRLSRKIVKDTRTDEVEVALAEKSAGPSDASRDRETRREPTVPDALLDNVSKSPGGAFRIRVFGKTSDTRIERRVDGDSEWLHVMTVPNGVDVADLVNCAPGGRVQLPGGGAFRRLFEQERSRSRGEFDVHFRHVPEGELGPAWSLGLEVAHVAAADGVDRVEFDVEKWGDANVASYASVASVASAGLGRARLLKAGETVATIWLDRDRIRAFVHDEFRDVEPGDGLHDWLSDQRVSARVAAVNRAKAELSLDIECGDSAAAQPSSRSDVRAAERMAAAAARHLTGGPAATGPRQDPDRLHALGDPAKFARPDGLLTDAVAGRACNLAFSSVECESDLRSALVDALHPADGMEKSAANPLFEAGFEPFPFAGGHAWRAVRELDGCEVVISHGPSKALGAPESRRWIVRTVRSRDGQEGFVGVHSLTLDEAIGEVAPYLPAPLWLDDAPRILRGSLGEMSGEYGEALRGARDRAAERLVPAAACEVGLACFRSGAENAVFRPGDGRFVSRDAQGNESFLALSPDVSKCDFFAAWRHRGGEECSFPVHDSGIEVMIIAKERKRVDGERSIRITAIKRAESGD